jgi:hypothetical protein
MLLVTEDYMRANELRNVRNSDRTLVLVTSWSSANPITNLNLVYSHYHTCDSLYALADSAVSIFTENSINTQ